MSRPSSLDSPDETLFQTNFPPEELAARRARILDAIGPDAQALLQGAAPPRGFEMFRQANQFYYCCAVEEPQAYLRLAGADRTATLYLPSRPEGASHEGASFAAEDAELLVRLTGVDAVRPLDALAGDLAGATVLYTPHRPAEGRWGARDTATRADRLVAADPWDGQPSREQRLIGLVTERLPSVEIRDLSPILDGLRAVKSPREVAVLRRAGHLSALALVEAMRATRPGVAEYQLGAIASYVYLVNGARGEGYRHIIASGPNAWYGHYFRNSSILRDGDLVLMDTAPDYAGYTSDIGRMWPTNGTYAPWQRELYGFMVDYHKALLARIRPGVTADEVMDGAAAEMAEAVEATAFSKPVYEAAARRALEFRGHMSHPVGMAVHDAGGYRAEPLKPGIVLTVDPQMRVPEERLYIRVEDTIAVTDDGLENLTAAAPLDLDDVEALMAEDSPFPIPD